MNRIETAAGSLMLLALQEEEQTGKPRLYGTIYEIAKRIQQSEAVTSRALRLTRTPEFIAANGYSFPSLGNGRSGEKYGYVLEYSRPGVELANEQMRQHAERLVKTLRSLTAQYELADTIVDGRTSTAKEIKMALKAVDLAADALEVGLGQ